jgi:hypothetical protein
MKRIAIVFALLLLVAAPAAHSQMITDQFNATIDEDGNVMGGGTGYYAGGDWVDYEPWYPYPSGWINQWFYDHPFDPLRGKIIHIEITVSFPDPSQPSGLVFAVNWSTPEWSNLGYGDTWPPIPEYPGAPFDEELYIRRVPFIGAWNEPDENVEPGPYVWNFIIYEYNPEWVSIDIQGYNVEIVGTIEHECVDKQFGTEESSWGAVKSMYR